MSEEGKTDLTAFDHITDRVARAKAKAEAIRRARAGTGEGGVSPLPARPPTDVQSSPESSPSDSVAETTAPSPPEAIPSAPAPPPPPRRPPSPRKQAQSEAELASPAPAGIAGMSTVEKAAATRRQRASALSRSALESKTAERADAPLGRRGFLSWLAVAWVAFAAAAAAGGAAMTRFLFPNVLFEPPQAFKAGLAEDYDTGKVDERWKEKYGVWVVRDDQGIFALSTTCTHLGCTPNWLEAEGKYKCPCHGSGFYRTGINFEGPAPRPLERFRIVLADDGQILIDKTRKYQQEKGQWDDPDSYLKLL